MSKRSLTFALAAGLLSILTISKTWMYRGVLLYGWDAQFYFAQARSLLFDGQLDITDALQATPQPAPFDRDGDGYLEQPPRYQERIVNKYPIGLSLLEIPWLAIGHGLRSAWGFLHPGRTSPSPVGYSNIEIAAVAVGLLVYSLVGLVLLCQLVRDHSQGGWTEFAVWATVMGTSLFYYFAVFPFMAHGVAFTLVVLLLWQVAKLRNTASPGSFPFHALAATCGLLFLVRPQHIVLLPLLVPFLWPAVRRLRYPWLQLLLPCLLFAAICSVQSLCNYSHFGSLSANAYAAGQEGFNWLHPNMYIVLISPHRGLFWMNPIVLLAIYGFVRYRVVSWFEGAVLLHGIIQVYLIATWSSPWQGDAFGPRMWCECAPLVALGIAKLLTHARPPMRWMWATISLGAVLWTNLLMVLYIKGQLVASCTHRDLFWRLVTLHL